MIFWYHCPSRISFGIWYPSKKNPEHTKWLWNSAHNADCSRLPVQCGQWVANVLWWAFRTSLKSTQLEIAWFPREAENSVGTSLFPWNLRLIFSAPGAARAKIYYNCATFNIPWKDRKFSVFLQSVSNPAFNCKIQPPDLHFCRRSSQRFFRLLYFLSYPMVELRGWCTDNSRKIYENYS